MTSEGASGGTTRIYVRGPEWGTVLEVNDPDNLGEAAIRNAAAAYLQDGFDLSDYMRGITVEPATESDITDATIIVRPDGMYDVPDDE